ncbi:MAG: FAD-dependent oxidoreductase [Pacificimonas sp.]|nr:FAD-dependent oxidoreductase [Pacificimonas sp.]
MSGKKIAIIGSGIAGLTAGYRLQQQGHEVKIIDRASFAGGRMADLNYKGLNVHSGATIAWTLYADMMDLIDEFGMRDEIAYFEEGSEGYNIVDNGSMTYPLMWGFSPGFFLKHPAFSLATKAKLAKLIPDLVSSAASTDPNLMHTATAYDDKSIADYFLEKGMDDFLHNYIDPMFRGPWNWKVADISRAYLISLMGHLPGSKVFSFKNGIGTLTRALAGKLDIQLNTEVTQISEEKAGKREIRMTGPNGPETLEVDLVICAIQGNKVATIVSDLSAREKQFFDQVRYTDCGIVYYILDRKPERMNRWYPSSHPNTFALYEQYDEDSIVPENHTQPPHLYCEISPEAKEKIKAENGQHNLDKYARPQALELYPNLENELVDVVEQWIDEMLPEWYVGYATKMREFLLDHEAQKRSLYFCGDYLSNSHTGGACASGARVAATVEKHLAGS